MLTAEIYKLVVGGEGKWLWNSFSIQNLHNMRWCCGINIRCKELLSRVRMVRLQSQHLLNQINIIMIASSVDMKEAREYIWPPTHKGYKLYFCTLSIGYITVWTLDGKCFITSVLGIQGILLYLERLDVLQWNPYKSGPEYRSGLSWFKFEVIPPCKQSLFFNGI